MTKLFTSTMAQSGFFICCKQIVVMGRILRQPSERGCVEDQPQQLEQTWCWNSPASLCVSRAAAGLSDTAAFRGKSPPRAVSRCARSNEGGALKMETFKPSGYN